VHSVGLHYMKQETLATAHA